MIDQELKVENFYFTKPVEEIVGAVFDYAEALREALLIELPRTAECNGGKCPERAMMAPYLRPENRKENPSYFPFADMDNP
jgi:hypothetical protein